jgi:hypothetical protein
VQGQKERKEREALEKVQRLEGWEARKAAKAAAEVEWAVIMAIYQQAMKDWMAECERLQAEKVRVKDLPSKPKRPPKPKPVVDVVLKDKDDTNNKEEDGEE